MDNILAKTTWPSFRFFGRAEMKELPKVLAPDEQVLEAVFGYYQGGSGLLVVTDKRVLLIDKQPLYVNLEALAHKYITKVEFSAGRLQASLKVCAGSHGLHFRSLSDAKLKALYYYIQARVETEHTQVEKVLENTTSNRTAPVLLPRRRLTKFYPLQSSVIVSQLDS